MRIQKWALTPFRNARADISISASSILFSAELSVCRRIGDFASPHRLDKDVIH